MERTAAGIVTALLAGAWLLGPAGAAEGEPAGTATGARPKRVRRLAAPRPAPWRKLFNGKDLTGWHVQGHGRWTVEEGELVGTFDEQGGGWLLTDEEFSNFTLRLQFKVRKGGNSGVCIRFPKDPAKRRNDGSPDPAFGGYEIQIYGVHEAKNPTGSIYDMARAYTVEYTREQASYWKDDDWNAFEITARFDHVRAALNGRVVADLFDRGSLSGMIGLQLHEKDTPVRFKDIEIRSFPVPERFLRAFAGRPAMEEAMEAAPGAWIPLFDGSSLKGWKILWGGRWTVEDGAITGRWWEPETEEGKREKAAFEKEAGMAYRPYGWLVTEKEYGDFILKCRFKIDEGGNSGLCVRYPSERWGGDPAWEGYEIQVEDTKDPRNWDPSGCIYAMARAYPGLTRSGEWNDYTIYCRGARITVYLNGRKAVDFLDRGRTDPRDRTKRSEGPRSRKGHIGFQIHDRGKKVQFRDIRIKSVERRVRVLRRPRVRPARKRQPRSIIQPPKRP